MYGLDNDSLIVGGNVLLVTSLISLGAMIFAIYVGICIVAMRNDLRKLKDLELKKYEEGLRRVGSEEVWVENVNVESKQVEEPVEEKNTSEVQN